MSDFRIEDLDSNFKTFSSLRENDIKLYDVRKDPFQVYGLYDYKNQPAFKRIPDEIALSLDSGVKELYMHTAGGRLRFSTDSRYIAIKSVMPSICRMSHMPLSGSSGFDLYIDRQGTSRFYRSFIPPVEMDRGYESIVYFNDERMKNITIYFPLYNGVDSLYIGLQKEAKVLRGAQYGKEKPMLFYGSSITQGGCASRPGTSYPAVLSRRFDRDYINLGFSGGAFGEKIIADYIADMDMSAFIYDYDHNAKTVAHLEITHEQMFRIIRAKNPKLPVIMISRPDFDINPVENSKFRQVIVNTYLNAVKHGDKKVWFVDGERLFGEKHRDSCTVDGNHPNDAGFLRMADGIGDMIEQAFTL